MPRDHRYHIEVAWTGNLGQGTAHYRAYSRDHEIRAPEKSAVIPGSSDPVFRGDRRRYSPEEMLAAALSSCHMLWLLHLCADAGIVVEAYTDAVSGILAENTDGSGQFTEVVLNPRVTVADPARIPELDALHERAHQLCFIARSVNFPVRVNAAAICSVSA
jgi:organic hydroperoxide reductase OsmC/OhrA